MFQWGRSTTTRINPLDSFQLDLPAASQLLPAPAAVCASGSEEAPGGSLTENMRAVHWLNQRANLGGNFLTGSKGNRNIQVFFTTSFLTYQIGS